LSREANDAIRRNRVISWVSLYLFAAVISAAAAAAGAMVPLAQYRQSRSAPHVAPSSQAVQATATTSPVSSPPPPPLSSPRNRRATVPSESPEPAADLSRARSARTLRRAILVTTVCCFTTAVSELSYWAQQGTSHSAALEVLLNVGFVLSGLASLVAVLYAVRIALSGISSHRWRDLRVAGWVFLGSTTPWIGLWIQVLINRNVRGIGS
jgi:uncharacterized membrane protein YhaH (DUF805 family)